VGKVKGWFSEFWDRRAQAGVPVLLRRNFAGGFELDAGRFIEMSEKEESKIRILEKTKTKVRGAAPCLAAALFMPYPLWWAVRPTIL
jgi:hypothetical protein